MNRPHCLICLPILLGLFAGCGNALPPPPAPLFTVPLIVAGQPVGEALIDTGGGYEVLLRDNFDLEVVNTIEVLVFGGPEQVNVTEGFAYSAGGLSAVADGAIVGISSCDCNGIGIDFFRKTGVILGLDFSAPAAAFLPFAPQQGVTLAFEPPPERLAGFSSSFIEVEVEVDGVSRKALGLVDTGANATTMRRDLIGDPTAPLASRLRATVTNGSLGTVSVSVALFDTAGLPDIILGTDVMRAWGDRWYFSYTPTGGTVTVVRSDQPAVTPSAESL